MYSMCIASSQLSSLLSGANKQQNSIISKKQRCNLSSPNTTATNLNQKKKNGQKQTQILFGSTMARWQVGWHGHIFPPLPPHDTLLNLMFDSQLEPPFQHIGICFLREDKQCDTQLIKHTLKFQYLKKHHHNILRKISSTPVALPLHRNFPISVTTAREIGNGFP